MSKNLCGKTRDVEDPYEVWRLLNGSWEWRVLKKYQNPENEAKNQYARWFCAVFSPVTREQMSSGYELGDVYVKDVTEYAFKVDPKEIQEEKRCTN